MMTIIATATTSSTVIRSLGHHAVFLLLLQLSVLLFMARFMGEIMRKLGQPAVVGELMAGVVMGPSVLGLAYPGLQEAIFPLDQHQSDLLAVVSWLGVLFLLIITGLETDIGLIKRRGKAALIISAGGIIVPFATGLALGMSLPEAYRPATTTQIVFALFIAVAMSISAVPVIAKVLMDLKLTRRDIGQLILAAAMTDDTVGWILLAVVAGLATAGTINILSIGQAVGAAALFLLLAFTIGASITSRIITATDRLFGGTQAQLSIVLVIALGAAAFTHQMGIEAVLGAFVMGILIVQAPRFRHEVAHVLESITNGFLAPVFFASAGVKVNLIDLGDPDVLTVGFIVLSIACIGKFVGAYIGSWAAGISHWERLAMGSGMNARGAMEIVVATVGLGLGVLTTEMYSIIVMVAIVTSLMAPPLLRWTLSRVRMGADEAARLEREEIAAASFVRSVRRVLVLGRTPRTLRIPIQMIAYLNHEQPLEVTGIYARPRAVRRRWWWPWGSRSRRYAELTRIAIDQLRRSMSILQGPREMRVITDADRIDIALTEASRGYDLAVLADVQRSPSSRTLFSTAVDAFLRRSPCATIVFKSPRATTIAPAPFTVWRPTVIIVPTVGTEHCKRAVEVASVLASSTKAKLVVLHVSRRAVDGEFDEIGQEIVDLHADWGRKFGAECEPLIVEGAWRNPEDSILHVAQERSADLIVLGSNLRVVSARAFFGHRVERLLKKAACPVAIVSTPA